MRQLFLILSIILFQHVAFSSESDSIGENKKDEFKAKDMIMHHIKDAHEWHLFDITSNGKINPISIPLPIILFYKRHLFIFLSSEFHHGTRPVTKGEYTFIYNHDKIYVANKKGELNLDENNYPINDKPFDFSITKNIAAMFISIILILILFISVSKSYNKEGLTKGIGSFLEPIIIFVRDDIAKNNISGGKHERYLPFLLTVFFFIWVNNLFGLIPILSPNLTGNITVTMVLATFTFLIILFSGNKNYWKHIFSPKIPIFLYPIIIPIEFAGMFIKPFALMIRLFANITAGHVLILSLVSIIFIFKSIYMSALSIPFMIFMNTIELLVGVLQAYIFTLLSALFIGIAVDEHH